MHDPRVGRFFAIDPLAAKYPHNSPYAFSENIVINSVELEGLEHVYHYKWFDLWSRDWGKPKVEIDGNLKEDLNLYIVYDVHGGVRYSVLQSVKTKKSVKYGGQMPPIDDYYDQFESRDEAKSTFSGGAIGSLSYEKDPMRYDNWEGGSDASNSGYVSPKDAKVGGAVVGFIGIPFTFGLSAASLVGTGIAVANSTDDVLSDGYGRSFLEQQFPKNRQTINFYKNLGTIYTGATGWTGVVEKVPGITVSGTSIMMNEYNPVSAIGAAQDTYSLLNYKAPSVKFSSSYRPTYGPQTQDNTRTDGSGGGF